MHDDADIEGRISRLEGELAELQGSRAGHRRVTARARRLGVMLAIGMFAAGLPAATWLQLRGSNEAAVAAAKAEYKLERRLQGYHHKQERNMRFIEAALAPGASDEDRASALRFLVAALGERSVTRKWAKKELDAIETRSSPPVTERPCQRRASSGAATDGPW